MQQNLQKVSEKGFDALALIGESVTAQDCAQAESMLKMNYGIDYPKEKMNMLWSMIKEEGWSAEKLKATVKWFMKNKRYPNWTIADWFDYKVKLYPYSWYLKQVNEFGGDVNEQIERYRINGKVFYRYMDGTELPFEKLN